VHVTLAPAVILRAASVRTGRRPVEHFRDVAYRNSGTATALSEDGLQVAFKQSTGVLEVLFCVGFGGDDFIKRVVEDANDALRSGNGGIETTRSPKAALLKFFIVAPVAASSSLPR
jgi:hypothetical protein